MLYITPIQVTVDINAPKPVVWARVRDIGDHVSWMADATAIRFTSATTEGVGTSFDCDTRVGPLRMTDRMVVTEWSEGDANSPSAITIRHGGAVGGTGRIEVAPSGDGRSRMSWTEDLHFAPWLGGRIAAALARPVLRRIWRANVERLRDLIEGSPTG